MNAARRARQKARKQQDNAEQLTLFDDPPDTPNVVVQAGLASAAAAAGEQDKD